MSELGDVELCRSLLSEAIEVTRGIEDSKSRSAELINIGK